MTIASLVAAQSQPVHHARAPRPQPQPDPTQPSDQQPQSRALEAEKSINLLV